MGSSRNILESPLFYKFWGDLNIAQASAIMQMYGATGLSGLLRSDDTDYAGFGVKDSAHVKVNPKKYPHRRQAFNISWDFDSPTNDGFPAFVKMSSNGQIDAVVDSLKNGADKVRCEGFWFERYFGNFAAPQPEHIPASRADVTKKIAELESVNTDGWTAQLLNELSSEILMWESILELSEETNASNQPESDDVRHVIEDMLNAGYTVEEAEEAFTVANKEES